MDLSKAEKTISSLEEHGKKVAKISEAVEKFEKLSNELKVLPDQIEKNNSSTAVRILDLEKKFEKENDNLGKIFKEAIKDLNNNNKKEKEDFSKKIETSTIKYVEGISTIKIFVKGSIFFLSSIKPPITIKNPTVIISSILLFNSYWLTTIK